MIFLLKMQDKMMLSYALRHRSCYESFRPYPQEKNLLSGKSRKEGDSIGLI